VRRGFARRALGLAGEVPPLARPWPHSAVTAPGAEA